MGALLLEVAGKGGGRASVAGRAGELVGANQVVDGQQAVAGVGVGQVIDGAVLLGRGVGGVAQQAAAAQGAQVAVVVVAGEGEAVVVRLGGPGVGADGRVGRAGHEVALPQVRLKPFRKSKNETVCQIMRTDSGSKMQQGIYLWDFVLTADGFLLNCEIR